MRPDGDELQRLGAYLSGELVGDMGLRCALGSFLEYRARIGSSPSSEMSGRALAAARTAQRVEAALELIEVQHRAVLRALYDPAASGVPVLVAKHGGVGRVADVVAHPDEVRLLVACAASKSPCRAVARASLKKVLSTARIAVTRAEKAYLAAVPLARRELRRRRNDRLSQGLGRE